MQPKKYQDPKIALLNIELELKSERENAEIRIDNVEVCGLLNTVYLIIFIIVVVTLLYCT